jgi:hypothetical protein
VTLWLDDMADVKALWLEARSLTELGELTARWLEGGIDDSPWYGTGPDPETTELIPILAKLNRIGFVTDQSQPGEGPSDDGSAQRANVSGFTSWELARWLEGSLGQTDLVINAIPAGEDDVLCTLPITLWPDEVKNDTDRDDVSSAHTWDGGSYSRGTLVEMFLRDPGEVGLCEYMVAVLQNSLHVTLVDPVWGRSDLLWTVLDDAAESWNEAH